MSEDLRYEKVRQGGGGEQQSNKKDRRARKMISLFGHETELPNRHSSYSHTYLLDKRNLQQQTNILKLKSNELHRCEESYASNSEIVDSFHSIFIHIRSIIFYFHHICPDSKLIFIKARCMHL